MSEGWHDPNRVAGESVLAHRSLPGFGRVSRLRIRSAAVDTTVAVAWSREMQ